MAGHPDFSGYWRQVKHDNFDGFLRDLGFPWVLRKAAIKYGSKTTDIIHHAGPTLRVTTVNAKGSWTRKLVTGKEVVQRNAEGDSVTATAWWEGGVHKSRLTGGRHGPSEHWRYMEAGLMVVKTMVMLEAGREAVVWWYLEALHVPPRAACLPGGGLPRQLARDQERVRRATAADNQYLQHFARQAGKWETPADTYISYGSASEADHKDVKSPLGSPRSSTMTPADSAPSATAAAGAFLPGTALPPAGRHRRTGSESRFAPSAANNSMAHHDSSAAAQPQAQAQPPPSHPAAQPAQATAEAERSGDAAAAALPNGDRAPPPGAQAAAELPPGVRPIVKASSRDDLRGLENKSGPGSMPRSVSREDVRTAAAAAVLAADGSAVAAAAAAAAAAARDRRARRTSGRSAGPLSEASVDKSHASASRARGALTQEEELGRRLGDWADARSLTSVVPLDNPLASDEPELLEMSPEQAEETQLKMRELELELARATLQRQRWAAGVSCLCCTCVLEPYTIPPYVRAWDM